MANTMSTFFRNYWVETKLDKNKIHVCSNKLSFLSPNRVIIIYMKVAMISRLYRQLYVSRLGRLSPMISDIKSVNIYMVPSIKVLASMIYSTFEQHAARE